MNKQLSFTFISVFAAFLLMFESCVSTPSSSSEPENTEVSGSVESLEPTTTDDSIDNQQTSVLDEPEIVVNSSESEQTVTQYTPVEDYKALASNYLITALSVPAPTTNGKAFKRDYSVCVLLAETNEPAADLSITALYPCKKDQGAYEYAEVLLTTDIDGVAIFSCPIPEFSANSNVLFYVTPDYSKTNQAQIKEIKDYIKENSLSVPYQVKTNYVNRGGSISLLDYDKKGKPITNNSVSSSALLSSLMRLGFTGVGNADFSEQIASGNESALFKQAENLFERSVAYLIYGTVKYDGEIIKDDNGCTVKLIVDVTCYDMLNKKKLMTTTLNISSTEKTELDALNNARVKIMGPQLAEMVLYGM